MTFLNLEKGNASCAPEIFSRFDIPIDIIGIADVSSDAVGILEGQKQNDKESPDEIYQLVNFAIDLHALLVELVPVHLQPQPDT